MKVNPRIRSTKKYRRDRRVARIWELGRHDRFNQPARRVVVIFQGNGDNHRPGSRLQRYTFAFDNFVYHNEYSTSYSSPQIGIQPLRIRIMVANPHPAFQVFIEEIQIGFIQLLLNPVPMHALDDGPIEIDCPRIDPKTRVYVKTRCVLIPQFLNIA